MVEQTRQNYRISIASLPPPFKEHVEAHLSERLGRTSSPLLGEFVPWIVADILGVKSASRLKHVAAGWAELYFSVMLLDDIIDGEGDSDSIERMLAANLLQQRGICTLLSNSAHPQALAKTIDSAFSDNAVAAHHEIIRHRNRLSRFNQTEIRNLGRKLAIVRVCIAAVASMKDVSVEEVQWLYSTFDELLAGLQLLDDITDWEEDFRIKSFTLPLTLASRRSPGFHEIQKDDHRQILHDLISTGAFAETLEIALAKLRKAAESLRATHHGIHSRCFEHLHLLMEKGAESHGILKRARSELKKIEKTSAVARATEEAELLARVTKQLRVVAQSS